MFGQMLDLNDSMASTKGSLTVDGKQYGVPWGYYQWGVYYRKDLFDELGLNVPRDWDEFKWVCAMLKKMELLQLLLVLSIYGLLVDGLII